MRIFIRSLFAISWFWIGGCQTELNTNIDLPAGEKEPVIHVIIENTRIRGEVVAASTNFENIEIKIVDGEEVRTYVLNSIGGVEIEIWDNSGNSQKFVADSMGVFEGEIQIDENESYQLRCDYKGEIFVSNWISPLPKTIDTEVQKLVLDGYNLFAGFKSSLSRGYFSFGPKTYFEGSITDSIQPIGLAYNNWIEFEGGLIEFPGMEISKYQEFDSVVLEVVYADSEYQRFFENLGRNVIGESYTSYEPAYSNIGMGNGLFCFAYRDTFNMKF
ncbi:hypothetical protein [Membranihabitans marinus]|uniref:hypothetical protein n=1 Tax=Membranihabitans marinus TaxID=1227546 RepID=UPI001F2EBFD3|nr:hypothetical protein [Membranihabitans marinus]